MDTQPSRDRGFFLVFAVIFALSCVEPTSPKAPVATTPEEPGAATHQIAYYGITESGGAITLINSDGSSPVVLAVGWTPAWSPDGRKLVFSNTQCDTDWETYLTCEKGGLVIMDVGTREIVMPPAGFVGEEPAWSPNGELIAFVRRDTGHLYVMSLDGSKALDIHPAGVALANNPSWSPDARRILFQCGNGTMGVCMVNADGTDFTLLSAGTSGESRVSPSWSPDGTQIAFAILSGGQGRIAVMSPDGSGQIILADGLGPAWSADGTQIAFSRNNLGLYTMNRDGSHVKRIVTGIANSPAWRP